MKRITLTILSMILLLTMLATQAFADTVYPPGYVRRSGNPLLTVVLIAAVVIVAAVILVFVRSRRKQ